MSQEENKICTTDVDGVCEACGSFVELGSVIAADDTTLILPFSGADKASVEQLAQKYIDAAKERFPEVIVATEESAEGKDIKLKLTFDCTAEKLIFEMGLSAIN